MGGSIRISEAMAEPLGDRIRLDTPVRRIERDAASLPAGTAPELVLLGDYIDRGTASRGVVDRLLATPPEAPGRDRIGPLDGILVIDFGVFAAGPFGPRQLRDMGARVIKVEEIDGDRKFLNGPKLAADSGHSSQDDIDSMFVVKWRPSPAAGWRQNTTARSG